jgi:UDP-N-acetylglucosamine acyltransferase
MAQIHPSAIVDPGAELAPDVEVGPFAVIGPRVRIGAGTRIGAHAVIEGRTRIGAHNRIHPFCVIGGPPQDKKYRGEDTELELGDHNTVREYCTMNTGTEQGGGLTRVGSHNWIMAYVHVAHDCLVGDHTILANSVQLAGHVHVGDWAILGGITGVHQFVRIGAHAMTGAGTTLLQDLPTFVICNGNPAEPHGINIEGLKRRGFSPAAISGLRRAYKTLYKEGHTLAAACGALEAQAAEGGDAAPHVTLLREFLRASTRGIVR